jgi:arylformamidase
MSTSRDLTPEAVERGYNNRAAVPDHQRWLDEWVTRSRAAIEALRPDVDVRYGGGPNETLDLYTPAAKARGTFVFIHGGWWRSLDKADYAFVAPAFVAAGYAVAMVNYQLCPGAPIVGIVDQCRRAVAFVAREGPARNADAPLVVGGHSAGGHLTAMMYTIDWRDEGFPAAPFAGGVSLSGVHELAPLVHFSHNVDFRLDPASARDLSPAEKQPRTDAPLLLAVGADETSEFVRQTDLMWDAWPRNHPRGARAPLHIAGRQHYSVVLDYVDPASALTRATLSLFPAHA